jgi:hypothetical protein
MREATRVRGRSLLWLLVVVAVVASVVFAALTVAVTTNQSLALDSHAFETADDLRAPWLDTTAKDRNQAGPDRGRRPCRAARGLAADHAPPPAPRLRIHEPLLACRAAAVRTDLLEIAALLEHTDNPDPASVAALQDLLANGCDSPLYNTDIHISELHATLHDIRSSL